MYRNLWEAKGSHLNPCCLDRTILGKTRHCWLRWGWCMVFLRIMCTYSFCINKRWLVFGCCSNEFNTTSRLQGKKIQNLARSTIFTFKLICMSYSSHTEWLSNYYCLGIVGLFAHSATVPHWWSLISHGHANGWRLSCHNT